MREYEVLKDVYSPCAPDTQEFLELTLEDPEAYIRDLYKEERSAEFHVSEKRGSLVIEVDMEAAQRHRYTFNEI